MKSLLAVLCLLLLNPSLSASAEAPEVATKELQLQQETQWLLSMAHLVAYQPARVGWNKFAESLNFKSHMAPGKELFVAAKKIKKWPTLSIEGNVLKLTDLDGSTITIAQGTRPGEALVN